MKSAVLFLVFNRPEKTAAVFQAIRMAEPPRLYVSADGPRTDRRGEADICARVREIATAIDWPCQVYTLFRDGNLGCKVGVSSGLDWFFENEQEGIILEDDVLPDPTFFTYCDCLLELYRDDVRVAAVSGSNLVEGKISVTDSYFFSRYTHVWGWATWRRAWSRYDVAMSLWPEWAAQQELEEQFDASTAMLWRRFFQSTYLGRIDTWDFQWLFACWQTGALCALPSRNLTFNLGFDSEATHTGGQIPSYVQEQRSSAMEFPLTHPLKVERCVAADRTIDRVVFRASIWRRIRDYVGQSAKLLGFSWPANPR